MRTTTAKVAVGGVILIVMLLAAGCGTTTPFGFDAGAPATGPKATSAVDDPALGNLQTLDTCSLIPLDGLTLPAGVSRPDLQVSQNESFSGCDLVADLSSDVDDFVELDVDETITAAQLGHDKSVTISTRGRLRVITPRQQSATQCTYGVVTAADTYMTIEASSESGGRSEQCALARATLDDLVTTVNAGRIRHFVWPKNSMGGIEACSLISLATVAKASPGVDRRENSPDGHSCGFSVGKTSSGVSIETLLDNTPDTLKSERQLWSYADQTYSGTTKVVDGRHTLVGPLFGAASDGTQVCQAETTGRQWPHGFGNDSKPLANGTSSSARLYEIPTVVADGHESLKSECAIATTVATAVWPKLVPKVR